LSPQYHILVEFSFQGSKKFTRNIDVWTISMCWQCQRIGWSPVDFEISLAQANSGVNESELPKIFFFNCLHTYSVVDQNRNQRH
jgi:hypothetical protein